jgi:hypothetical protein
MTKKRKRARRMKVCPADKCGKEFRPRRTDQKYCGATCRQRVSRAKRREEKKELAKDLAVLGET